MDATEKSHIHNAAKLVTQLRYKHTIIHNSICEAIAEEDPYGGYIHMS
jgi:hypothetical protein